MQLIIRSDFTLILLPLYVWKDGVYIQKKSYSYLYCKRFFHQKPKHKSSFWNGKYFWYVRYQNL